MVRALLGLAYLTAYEQGIDPADSASRAVAHLEQARRLADGVALPDVLRTLARAYRVAGQDELACRTGFAALEEQAGLVLLQTGVGHAVLTARGAAADASALAEWCLADKDPGAALRAIELGRGLALHASTSTLKCRRCCANWAGRNWPTPGRPAFAGTRRSRTPRRW